MADNPNLRGVPDSKRVSLGQQHEVDYWTKTFGKTKGELQSAIDKVGDSVGKLREHFGL